MSTIKITSSAPLKMMIAGEWSVLQPGNHGIVTAVNARSTVTISRSVDKWWSITTTYGKTFSEPDPPSRWKVDDPYWKFACTLLKVAAKWYPLTVPLAINIENPPAARYGLGSSAAVSAALAAAVITAVSGQPPDKDEILRLALIAHTKAQGWRGSGTDCAAAVYGGTIAFKSFDIRYLQRAAEDRTTWDLFLPDLRRSVCRLPKTPFQDMVPIWTGQKESTHKLIQDSEPLFRSETWRTYVAEGEKIALGMANSGTKEESRKYLLLGRNWFYAINELTAGRLVPREMKDFLDLLWNLGISAKPSGAGGGDCLVGMLPPEPRDSAPQKLTLPLTSNAEGVVVESRYLET
jgi:phosphomevalonate kinase